VTSASHETHLAAAASHARAAEQAVAEVKPWALAVLAPKAIEAVTIDAARRNLLIQRLR
jgi:hypothetical protein